ncbi:MAG: T9SS type A sorting domain-containing protein, partial [Bacteroidota bacterium]
EQYIYVGDVGNNSGDRKNLRIYKIEKQQLLGDTAFAEIIDLQWPDQESFEPQPNATNFDCEAFVVYNDSLHLFSKNWLDQRTRHYVLPTSPGEHTARLVETFNSQGLITAASVNEEGIVVLLGYTDVGTVFLWLLYDFDGTHFFSGNKRRVELGSGLVNGKTEAITFSTDLSGYVAAENFEQSIFRIPPKLFRFDLAPLFELPTAINSPHSEAALQWMAAPNPFDESLRIFHHDYKRSISANTRFYLHDSVGRCVMRGTSSSAEQTWSTQQLGAGFYLLQVVEESGKRYSIRLIKY